ncbi:hypothetical protein INR49_019963 [Caranx melampygus]|nr:hypothetical protein INR49_019963 [Caranx melampygus]
MGVKRVREGGGAAIFWDIFGGEGDEGCLYLEMEVGGAVCCVGPSADFVSESGASLLLTSWIYRK